MNYVELAEMFFRKTYELKKMNHQQMLDESFKGEVFTLVYLQSRECPVQPKEISSEMNISSARVASILNNMENKGFIVRRIDKEDRRRILVNLTDKGKDQAVRHKQKVIRMMAGMLEKLGEKDASEFVRITGRLVDMASDLTDNPLMEI